MSNSLLKVENISRYFGGLKAVEKVSFEVLEGSLYGLIGPNGAGKTTLFNVITGVYEPSNGEVYLRGQKIAAKKPYEIAKLGMTRTFQNIRLFKNLSVLENVMVAADLHKTSSLLSTIFQTTAFLANEKKLKQKSMDLLNYFDLADLAHEKSSSLPYGAQRKLEIVRALATDPKIILLDEPAAGMNNSETEKLMQTLESVRKDFKIALLLIEHDMKLVMGICERIAVLDQGEKIAEGNAAEIRASDKVIEAYLGKEDSL